MTTNHVQSGDGRGKWSKGMKIQIKIADGLGGSTLCDVEATVFGAWALHRENGRPSRWAITHVPSGLRIPPFYTENMVKATALATVKELADKFGPETKPTKRNGKRIAEVCHRNLLGHRAILAAAEPR